MTTVLIDYGAGNIPYQSVSSLGIDKNLAPYLPLL